MVFSNVKKFYNLRLSKDKYFVRRLETVLGYVPVHVGLYKQAFFHKSGNNDRNGAAVSQNNERLEYLGDAILGSIVAEYLFCKYPSSDEGFLTKMRSKIVKRQTLNKVGESLDLGALLSENNSMRLSRSMLGNALEALIGAMYLEIGFEKTKKYIVKELLQKHINIHELESYDDNYKSRLLEWGQKNNRTVAYKVIAKYKLDKRDRFKVAVLVDGSKLSTADDFNKKSAEQMASERALLALNLTLEED